MASATSLPRAPEEEVASRVRHYAITMTIRMACFALMLFITPYGWYTAVFALAAAILPYIAVVIANAGADSRPARVERPEIALTTVPDTDRREPVAPPVLRVQESGPREDPR